VVASPPVTPPPAVASPAAPGPTTAAANPAPRPAQPAPANPVPVNPPGDRVAAVPPDRPQPPDAAARPSPTVTPAPSGRVAGEGGYRIQLAAVRDQADARRAWDLFVVDLGPVLKGVKPFIERADTGNGVFYRIQVGPFASLQEAESLCDQLKQRNASCFVIRR
jgi:cell division septation protein DedD